MYAAMVFFFQEVVSIKGDLCKGLHDVLNTHRFEGLLLGGVVFGFGTGGLEAYFLAPLLCM